MLLPFELHHPLTVAEAVAARERFGDAAALYAGGSELVLVMKEGLAAYEHLIDVKSIPECRELALRDGKSPALRIGAAVTHGVLERSPLVRERFPLLAEMEAVVANARVRSVGTLGGNLAFAEPHSDPPTALLVHDATVTIAGPRGARTLPLADFIRGSYETALEPDEILVHVDVPEPSAPAAAAYVKFGFHERPTIGIAVLLRLDATRQHVADARIAVGCVGPVPARLASVESAVLGVSRATLEHGFAGAAQAGEGLDAVSDLHGSADYKRHLVGVFVSRALATAARRAGAASAARSKARPAKPEAQAASAPRPHPAATPIAMTVNGRRVELSLRPEELLLDVLRERLGLTGSKRSCDVQVCGACTVILAGKPVSSCSVLAYEARDQEVTTIEALVDGERLHPIQESFVMESAFQCGFCTPGMIMGAKALLDEEPDASDERIRERLRGNICRCTGYTNILRAVASARDRMAARAT